MRYWTTKCLSIGCIILILLILFIAYAIMPQPVRGQTVTVPVGIDPWDVAITPNGEYAYVTSYDGSVYVINTATNTVTTTVTVGGGPNHVAVTPNGAYAYVTNSQSGSVSVINTSSNTVTTTVNLDNEPAGVAVTPDGAYAYVTNGPGSVAVLNTTTNTVTAGITVGSYPLGVAVTPDGEYVYVANYVDGTVSVISTATNTVTTTISLPFDSKPLGIAITPNGEYAYVTNQDHNTTIVISTTSNTVTTTVTGLSDPYGVAVAPNGKFAYVTDQTTDSVSAINTATNTVMGSVTVGNDPGGIAVTPNGAYAYVTNLEGNTVSVINIGALTASVIPSSTAIDMGQTALFTATAFGGSGSYTTYQWYVNGSAQSGQTASTFTFVPAFAGSYVITATVTDSSGATSTQSNAAKITVNVPPTVSISPVGPLSLPIGQVQQFTATTSGGSGTINYQWFLDGSAVGTNSASYFCISAAGSHNVTCTVTDSAPIPVTSPASNAVLITGLSGASGALTIDNSWMEKVSIPSSTSGDEAAVLNGTIYIFGPTDYAYSPVTDTLTTIASMLTPRASFAVATCGSKIYVIGGYNETTGDPCSVNEAYDPATNTWATEASMPTSRSEMVADTVNGEIYVIGGRASDAYSTSITEIYNPATDSWRTDASMPYPVASAASAVAGNTIYVVGGEDDSHPPAGSQNVRGANSVNFNQIYNPAANTWSLGTPIPTSTLAAGAGATTGTDAPERVYVFGNIVGFGITSNQNYAYDPVTNSWQIGASMPYACSSPAVAVVSDLLFVMGDGRNVEQYTPIGYMSRTTVTATTNGGKEISLTLIGNVTSSQMSNVTITTDRSAATTTVSFIVTGLSGTTGFSNITIPLGAIPYGSTPIVYVDEQIAQNQGFTQDANNYYIWYITQFSTHQISIVFNTPSSPSSSPKHPSTPFSTATVAAVSGTSAAIIVGAALSAHRKKRKKNVSPL